MPRITRTRQTRWRTSDNSFWDTAAEAREHEKRIVLIEVLRRATGVESHQIVNILEALLEAKEIIIVLKPEGAAS